MGDRTSNQDAFTQTRKGFTLPELLIVILIITVVSVIALPTVLPALAHRQVSEAGRILQGALAGARDKAIHDGRPSGIRLLPDPAFPLGRLADGTINPASPIAYNRAVPIGPAPEYSEGRVTVRPRVQYAASVTGGKPCLVLEESPADVHGVPNPPVSWAWNVRVGDRIQLNNAGPWYTVIGPMQVGPAAGNSEMFTNVGPPGTASPLGWDYLLLVNGRDDNGNGFVDEGWDGVDNNSDGLVDEHMPGETITSPVDPNRRTTRDEWEFESWHGSAAQGMTSAPYTIRRRPMPAPNAREVALPTQMVVDASTVFGTRERSRLPADRFTGFVDVMINPDGSVSYTSPYGTPASFGMGDAFYHFWLAERQDVASPAGKAAPLLPIAEPGGKSTKVFAGQVIKGEWSLLTLFTRTGQIAVVESPPFDDPRLVTANRPYDINLPFTASQQGAR